MFWRLYLNDRDGAAVIVGEQSFPIHAGRLHFVPSGVKFTCSNSTLLKHLYVHFDLLGMPKAAMWALFSQPVCLADGGILVDEAISIRMQMEQTEYRDISMQCRLKGLVCACLGRYLEQIPDEQSRELSRMTDAAGPIQPAIDAVERSIGQPLRNPDLASLCCMSTDYFTRVFHQCMNQTPAQFVQERRVMRAAQQLLFTNASIEEIAEENGFANRFYFTRVFTRHIGIGPAGYRAQSQRD
jgi:AraC-like DNA-binding protein